MMSHLRTARALCLVVTACLTVGCGNPAGGPQFHYVASFACGDIIAYTWNEPLTEYLVVEGDITRLGIGLGSTRTFEMASVAGDLNVRVDMYQEQASYPHCSDVVFPAHPAVWRATSGTVTITRSAVPTREIPSSYRVVITLENVVFEGPGRERARIPRLITFSGQGGWSPYG